MDSKDAPQIIEHLSLSVNFTPYDTKWIPCSAKFVAMGINSRGKGVLNTYEIDRTELKVVNEAEIESGVKCGTFGASLFEQRQLATGNYNGQLQIWDLNRLDTPVYEVKAHESMINCIDGVGGLNIGEGAPEIVTGGHDGKVRIWDPRQSEQVASLEPMEGQPARDCWAVCFGHAFNADERMVAAGYDNGDIKILDLRNNCLLWETNIANGVVGLEFDRKDIVMNKLLVTTLENKFSIFDMRTQHPEDGFAYLTQKAHKSTVWVGRHLPQNRDLFCTTGGNGTFNVYRYNYPRSRTRKDEKGRPVGVPGTVELLNSKKLADQPIVGFDWNQDKMGLACMCALDQTVKVVIVTRLQNY